jgi:hypothetical protein
MSRHLFLVDRLWDAYGWIGWTKLPLKGLTIAKLLRYPSQPVYVSDDTRTWEQPTVAWDMGRIRYFYEEIVAGRTVDPIEVDNECANGCIYAHPIVLDGHHRLAGSWLAKAPRIPVHYSGRVDVLNYLTGRRKTPPKDMETHWPESPDVEEPLHDITTDGRTVWVNGEGGLLGRFGPRGIDVHRPMGEQSANGECLYCTHSHTSAADWDTFVAKMAEHFSIVVPPRFKPRAFAV